MNLNLTDIVIKTDRIGTLLIQNEKVIYMGGRVICKQRAAELHQKTGCRVFNEKKGGSLVQIHPAENNCKK